MRRRLTSGKISEDFRERKIVKIADKLKLIDYVLKSWLINIVGNIAGLGKWQ